MMEGTPAQLLKERYPPTVPKVIRLAGAEATPARPLRVADLTRAFDNADLLLHYQPQVDVSQRWPRIVGYEAMSRWPLLDGSFVPPDRFIPLAESCGLITSLDIWVIETVCKELARRPATGAGSRFRMSANVSPQKFAQRQFAQSVADVLTRTGADPTRLTLEITERAVLVEDETTLTNIHALREIGISLALDDFGTGYSSLLLLSSLPIQEIKLDRTFVSGLPHRELDAKIISATIDLASGLGLRVVAEGVERAGQSSWLRQKGCNVIQGFLYGHPAPRSKARYCHPQRRS